MAKKIASKSLGQMVDDHGRKADVHATDVELSLDGGEPVVQRVLTAHVKTKSLEMTVEVGQTQDDWQAQLRNILNGHAPVDTNG